MLRSRFKDYMFTFKWKNYLWENSGKPQLLMLNQFQIAVFCLPSRKQDTGSKNTSKIFKGEKGLKNQTLPITKSYRTLTFLLVEKKTKAFKDSAKYLFSKSKNKSESYLPISRNSLISDHTNTVWLCHNEGVRYSDLFLLTVISKKMDIFIN